MPEQEFDPGPILEVLVRHRVDFVVIGGLAGIARGSAYNTHDVAVAYERSAENLSWLAAALSELGATLRGAPEGLPFQPDSETLRAGSNFTFDTRFGSLDILGDPAGAPRYNELRAGGSTEELWGLAIRIASIDHLIAMKEAAGRPRDLTMAAERFGGIDVLYNNAGISPADDDSILVTEADAWDRVQDVNTKGVYFCCKHGIPYLLERGGGSVINVASFVALVGAATSQIAYTASKGAVLSMSRELAVQFARQGVRVNALCPGPVETPLLMRLFSADPAAYERRRIHLPMGRLAQAREIASAALFLASDESSYVTGHTLAVTGGR